MLFRESGKEGKKSVRFIRTFYCSEAKGARQKTLGKIKIADVGSVVSVNQLIDELVNNEATDAEILEVKEWLDVMRKKEKENDLLDAKVRLLTLLKITSETKDEVLDLLDEEDQKELFSHIKNLEERLREKGIRRPRKTSKSSK